MKKILVLEWFIKKYPELISDMINTSHSIKGCPINPHHGEGDIYTHSLMVYNQILDSAKIEDKLSAILHDIGKPFCKKKSVDKDKMSFTGHENFSSFLAIKILNEFELDFNMKLNKRIILFSINFHNILHRSVKGDLDEVYLPFEKKMKINDMFHKDLELYESLFNLSIADAKGRISIDSELTNMKYELLENFIPYKGEHQEFESDLECHVMVGLPGSGKTTKIKKLLEDNPELVVLSIDEEILKLGKYSESYDSCWTKNNQKKAAEKILLLIEEMVKDKKSFIIDATNTSEKIRNRRLNKVSGRYKIIAHLQLASEDFIKNTMKNRTEKSVPMKNIYGMAKEFSYPTYIEFHEINTTIL